MGIHRILIKSILVMSSLFVKVHSILMIQWHTKSELECAVLNIFRLHCIWFASSIRKGNFIKHVVPHIAPTSPRQPFDMEKSKLCSLCICGCISRAIELIFVIILVNIKADITLLAMVLVPQSVSIRQIDMLSQYDTGLFGTIISFPLQINLTTFAVYMNTNC